MKRRPYRFDHSRAGILGRDLAEHKDYSEHMATAVDNEVKRILEEQYARAKKILTENVDKVKAVAVLLLEKEVLDAADVKRAAGFPDEGNPPANT